MKNIYVRYSKKAKMKRKFYVCLLVPCKTNFLFLKETFRELLGFSVGWVQFPSVLENFGPVVFLSCTPFWITNRRYSTPFGD